MQTFTITKQTKKAAQDAYTAVVDDLRGRQTAVLPVQAFIHMISPPVMDGLQTLTAGVYAEPVYRFEVNVFDNNPVPTWEGAVPSSTTLALQPVADESIQESQTVVFPDVISRRQFSQGLAKIEALTEAEAEEFAAMVVLPASMIAFISGLPEANQFDVRILLRSASEFSRNHPLTSTFATAMGMTPAQLDQFWIMCAAL